MEYVNAAALKQYFGIPAAGCAPATSPVCVLPGVFGAYLNSLTYRAQGMELEAQYQPTHRIFIRGGYTYLAPIVQLAEVEKLLTDSQQRRTAASGVSGH